MQDISRIGEVELGVGGDKVIDVGFLCLVPGHYRPLKAYWRRCPPFQQVVLSALDEGLFICEEEPPSGEIATALNFSPLQKYRYQITN